jgi:lysophospholipase L1-like esterase
MLSSGGKAVETINAGIGGERTDQALLRLDRDVIGRKPNVVTIMYGTNDSAIDAGKSAPRLPLEMYEKNLQTLVERLRQAGIQPVLMTPIPLCTSFVYMERSPYRERGPNHSLIGYVRAVRRVAARLDVPLVDHFGCWAEEALMGTDLNGLTTDGCHPNPAGHELMARTIYPVLAPLLGFPAALPGHPGPPAGHVAPEASSNLALGRPYAETSHNAHGYSAGLTDGITDSDGRRGVYATDSEDEYPKLTTIDLGTVQTVGRVVVINAADGSTRTISVSVSADGDAFEEVGRHEFACRDGKAKEFCFESRKTRYVRIAFEDSWGNVTHGNPNFMFLREVEVYAE